MRIIHTSDWHLGQHFIGRSRLAEHQAFLAWLVETVIEQQIDAIIVAGDIFDTATPPSYARELYNKFIANLLSTKCQLIIVGGNHDAAAVLNESRDLLTHLNTHVFANPESDLTKQLVPLLNKKGEEAALLCAIPFLRSRDLLQSQGGQSARDKQQSLQHAITEHYQQLFDIATKYNIEHNCKLPIVMTGHLTTVGVSASESVRDIYIGTLDAFASDAFPPADYIALGHIHQSRKLNTATDIRYSGSPIPLSFDEAKQQKQLWLIDFSHEEKYVESIAIPCFQRLLSLKASLKDIRGKVKEAIVNLTENEKLWLEIEISVEDAYLTDLQQRVELELEGLPIELLRLRRNRALAAPSFSAQAKQSLAEFKPEQVWQSRILQENLSDDVKEKLSQLHQQALAQVQEKL